MLLVVGCCPDCQRVIVTAGIFFAIRQVAFQNEHIGAVSCLAAFYILYAEWQAQSDDAHTPAINRKKPNSRPLHKTLRSSIRIALRRHANCRYCPQSTPEYPADPES